MDVKLGSNAIRNTNGVITIQGRAQLVFEWDPENQQIRLTMDFYDDQGTHLAHLRRNRWAFNQNTHLIFLCNPASPPLFPADPWLKILEEQSGETVLEAKITSQGTLSIPYGRFYSHRGHLVEISSHFCRLAGGTTMFGDVMDVQGGPIPLD